MRNALKGLLLVSVGALVCTFSEGERVSAERGGGAATTDCGDVNGDGTIDISDPVYLLNWLFVGGPPPVCLGCCYYCVNFDPLSTGVEWGTPAGHADGEFVFEQCGIKVTVHRFKFVGPGDTFGFSRTDGPIDFFGSQTTVNTNNINLEFDFSALPFVPRRVTFEFADLGGFENIAVNGLPVPIYAGELTAFPCAPGVTCTILAAPLGGGQGGTANLVGNITTLRVGGQEFWIDNVCAWR